MLLDDKLTKLDEAGEHLCRAHDVLVELGYIGLANSVLELCDEISDECANIEMEIEEQE